MRVPPHIQHLLRQLYHDMQVDIMCCGRTGQMFTALRGIKQGCPMSGSIFVLALDPFLRMMCHLLPPITNQLGAFADCCTELVPVPPRRHRLFCCITSSCWIGACYFQDRLSLCRSALARGHPPAPCTIWASRPSLSDFGLRAIFGHLSWTWRSRAQLERALF